MGPPNLNHPNPAALRPSTPRWPVDAARLAGLLWAITAASVLLVLTVPLLRAATGSLLHQMGLDPRPHPATAHDLTRRLAGNVRIAVLPLLLAAIGAARHRLTRTVADTVIAATLTVNAALVGGAIAVCGPRLLAYLPHLPLEWAGLACCAAPWLRARHRQLHTADWLPALLLGLVLLLAAAVVETYLTPTSRST